MDKSLTGTGNALVVDNSGKGNELNIIQNLSNLPSLLNPLLISIIDNNPMQKGEEIDLVEVDINTKISFNNVKVFANDLQVLTSYMSIIEEIINSIDESRPKSKETFLLAINKNYQKHKKNLFIDNDIDPEDSVTCKEIICKNADKLIRQVSETILNHYSNVNPVSIEQLESAKDLVVCYGFINCKILEPVK